MALLTVATRILEARADAAAAPPAGQSAVELVSSLTQKKHTLPSPFNINFSNLRARVHVVPPPAVSPPRHFCSPPPACSAP